MDRFFEKLQLYANIFWAWKYRNHAILSIAFIIYILFLTNNDVYTQIRLHKEMKEVEQLREYYKQQIDSNQYMIDRFYKDEEYVETYAREEFLMKKDKEEIFLVVD